MYGDHLVSFDLPTLKAVFIIHNFHKGRNFPNCLSDPSPERIEVSTLP